jgi:Mce-associated membrane protein
VPPRPRTRPRQGGQRRPRVAGMTQAAQRSDATPPARGPADARGVLAEDSLAETSETSETSEITKPTEAPAPPADPSEARSADGAAPHTDGPTPRPARRPRPRRSAPEKKAPPEDAASEAKPAEQIGFVQRRAVPLLAAALVVLAAAAAVFGVLDARQRSTPAASNAALVDVGGTAEAAGQLTDALETIYSFDFARLDDNEAAAREVITPGFGAEFDRIFAEVRQRAPEQQAVVSATVTLSAVKELTADRAVLVTFVDQVATRAAADPDAQQLAAAGRLTVTGERVEGRWKIAAVTPL